MNKHLDHQWLFCAICCNVSLSGTQVNCRVQAGAQLDEVLSAGMQQRQLHRKDQQLMLHFPSRWTERRRRPWNAWLALWNGQMLISHPTYNCTSLKPCLCWLTNKGLWLVRRRGSGEAEEPQEEMSLGWRGSESGGLQEDMRHKQPPLLLSWLHFVRLAKMTVTQ